MSSHHEKIDKLERIQEYAQALLGEDAGIIIMTDMGAAAQGNSASLARAWYQAKDTIESSIRKNIVEAAIQYGKEGHAPIVNAERYADDFIRALSGKDCKNPHCKVHGR